MHLLAIQQHNDQIERQWQTRTEPQRLLSVHSNDWLACHVTDRPSRFASHRSPQTKVPPLITVWAIAPLIHNPETTNQTTCWALPLSMAKIVLNMKWQVVFAKVSGSDPFLKQARKLPVKLLAFTVGRERSHVSLCDRSLTEQIGRSLAAQ